MTVEVIMTTADRRGRLQGLGGAIPAQNYVGQTLMALAAQGVRPHVFPTHKDTRWLGPLLSGLPVQPHLHVPARHLNRIENGAAAMLGAPPCDWVLHLEDDIEPCSDLMGSVTRWLTKHAREDRRIVLFWSRDTYEAVDGPADHPSGKLFGAVAVALRRPDALAFGEWVTRHARRWRSGTARIRGFDKMLRQWHQQQYPDLPFISASVPSLVQHIGRASSLSHLQPHGDFWQSPSFTGAAYV
jgi:hypothetical protein